MARAMSPTAACAAMPSLFYLQEHYPELMPDVKIRVIELMDHVLSTYDRKIGEFTAKQFTRQGKPSPLAQCGFRE